MIALVVTLVLFLSVGAALLRVLGMSLPEAPGARLAAFFIFGVAGNGIALYIAGVAGVPLNAITMASIPLVSLVVLVSLRQRMRAQRWPRVGHHPAAGVLLALPLIAILGAAAVLPVRDYDGRITWLPKAQAIAREASLTGSFFQGSAGYNAHNHYPLLLPINAAAVMRLSGSIENEAARWLYALVTIAGLLLARELLAQVAPSSAAWVIAAIAWLPMMVALDGGALSAYNDLPVAFLGGVALLMMAMPSWDDGYRPLPAVACLLAGLALTKNEGVVVAAAIVVAAVATGRARSLRECSLLVAPVVFAVGLLIAWRARVPIAYDEQYPSLFHQLLPSIGRVPAALRSLAHCAFQPGDWGGFWVATAAALVVAAAGPRRRAVLLPATMMLLTLAAYTAAFSVTPWNIQELAGAAGNRLLMHLILPAALLLALGGETAIEVGK